MPVIETTTGRLSYFDNGCVEGEAPRLMLLHSSAASHRQWRDLIARLGRHWHVVAPDLIGYGETPMPAHGSPTTDDEIALLTALLDQLDGPVHLVGHSYGGALALELARRHPQRIASLAMYEPVAFGLLRDGHRNAGWREITQVAQRIVKLADQADPRAAATVFLDYWIAPDALQAMPAAMQAYVIGSMAKVASEFRQMLAADETAVSDLAALTMPVLLLAGSEATLAVRGVVAELRRLLPNPRCVNLAGAAHMAPLTRPDLVNPLLLDFLELARQVTERGLGRHGAATIAAGCRP